MAYRLVILKSTTGGEVPGTEYRTLYCPSPGANQSLIAIRRVVGRAI